MNIEKVVFIFYTFEDSAKGSSWTYTNLPEKWWYVGGGFTTPVNSKKKNLYELEEQFQGPKNTQDKIIKYFDKFFQKLQKNKIIKIYKIRKSYLP